MKHKWIGFVLFSALCLTLCSNASAQRIKQITVAFRYDDYSNVSPTVIEEQIFRTFESCGFRLTVSVIPFTYSSATGSAITYPRGLPLGTLKPLSEDKVKLLRQYMAADVLEVAQHGFTHRPLHRWRTLTEFSGLDYSAQETEIKAGKEFIEHVLGVPVNIFVPPFDNYDSTTLNVMGHLGFITLSASRSALSATDRLWFVPDTALLEQLKGAVEAARRTQDPTPTVIILFHPFDFIEVNPERGQLRFSDFVRLLHWLRAQPDVTERSVGELTGTLFNSSAFVANHRLYYFQEELAPPFLRALNVTGTSNVYVSQATADALLNNAVWPDAAFYLLVLLVCAATTVAAARFMRLAEKVLRLGRVVLVSMVLLLAAYIFRNGDPLYVGSTVATCAAGALLGCHVALARSWLSTDGRTTATPSIAPRVR